MPPKQSDGTAKLAVSQKEFLLEKQNAADIMAQAYQVIGALAAVTGTFGSPEVRRALDYFGSGKFDTNFLPWIAPETTATDQS